MTQHPLHPLPAVDIVVHHGPPLDEHAFSITARLDAVPTEEELRRHAPTHFAVHCAQRKPLMSEAQRAEAGRALAAAAVYRVHRTREFDIGELAVLARFVRQPAPRARTNLKAQEATVAALWDFARAIAEEARGDARVLTRDALGGTHSSLAVLSAVESAMTRIADAHGYTLMELQ